MAKKNYYAVKKGRKTGIFRTWEECRKQVDQFKGAKFKGFASLEEAKEYINSKEAPSKTNRQVASTSVKKKWNPTNQQNCLEVYIDGSYNNKKNIAGYGLVIVKNDEAFLKDFSAYPYSDVVVSHNVGVELLGAKRAVELALANDYKDVVIYYDYIGIEKFATGEWNPKKKFTKEYQFFMKKYMNLLNINFVKVTAHSGNRFNEMADQLAKLATKL